MKRNNLVVFVEVFNGFYACNIGCGHHLCGAVGVECAHIHAEALGYAGHIAAHLTECMDTERFILQFRAGGAVVHVAHSHHCHTEHKFGHGI